MTWILWVAGTVVALVVLDRVALWAEGRGWIHWRHSGPSRGTAGTAMLQVQALFEPGIEHVVKERTRIGAEQPGDDEPPDPDGSSDRRAPRDA